MDAGGVLQERFGSFVPIPEEAIENEIEPEVLLDHTGEVQDEPPAKKMKMKSEIVFDAVIADGYPMSTCMCTGSDGAALMLGRHSGVMSRLFV